jgi:cell division protease FtsH
MAPEPSGQADSSRRPPPPGNTPPEGEHRHPAGWRVQPAPDGRGTPPPKQQGPFRSLGWRFVAVLAVLLALNVWISTLIPNGHERVRVPYTPTFIQQIQGGNVKSISSKGSTIQGEFRNKVKYPTTGKDSKSSTFFDTEVPTFANTDQLSQLLVTKNVTVNAKPAEQGRSLIANLLLGFGPTILLVGLFIWFARRAARQAGGGLMGLGRSRAKRFEGTEQPVTFDDVAGIDEAKEELTEIVDFLRNPDKYRRLGGRIPRGVLLSGPPGTGKTLLARAVAGEAHVPFFSMSASEFVEIIVGVGASRVRDLFEQAKKDAPAIVFIDELDAIGRSRSAGLGISGGNDEREQTLNQILTEMDGFDPTVGVIVLAATNRPEVLDPALLRPGRFDRRVTVQPPDTLGRAQILRVHTRHVPLADDVDLEALAATTIGMVGADLANLANEAALLAARRGHDQVTMADFTDAVTKIVLGAERKIIMSPEDRERTAYHEAGHAIVGMLTPGADPVRKVSIIPRGPSLGVTLSAPSSDRFSYDRRYLLGRIKLALGGRVAEQVVFDDVTSGASSDIQQLTMIAREMVGRFGMSDAIGPVAVIPADGQGPFLPGASEVSSETQRLVDEEVRRLVEQCEADTRDLLVENRERLDALAHALLDQETLDQADAYAAAGLTVPPDVTAPELAETLTRSGTDSP